MKVYKIGAIILKEKRLLTCRKKDESHFILPGGKPEGTETAWGTLTRELCEELRVEVASSTPFRTYQQFYPDKNVGMRLETHLVEISGEPCAAREIEEFRWITSQGEVGLAPIMREQLLPELTRGGLIS